LGFKNGSAEIKAHPWFEGLNWIALFDKKLKAPFIPLVKSFSDVSNFDPEFTQCEVESFSEASLKSEEGKAYFGMFSIT
jgi:serum/glucocorticoid-regulated kinase 2